MGDSGRLGINRTTVRNGASSKAGSGLSRRFRFSVGLPSDEGITILIGATERGTGRIYQYTLLAVGDEKMDKVAG